MHIKVKRFVSILLVLSLLLMPEVSTLENLGVDSQINVYAEAENNIEVGQYIQFGRYYDEPILWRIINKNGNGGFMLLSEKIICFKAFDAAESGKNIISSKETWGDIIYRGSEQKREEQGSNYWINSNIREWMNSDLKSVHYTTQPPTNSAVFKGWNDYASEAGFLTNFTDEERNAIQTTTHKSLLTNFDATEESKGTDLHEEETDIKNIVTNFDDAIYEDVTDKVFLLDVKELHDYVYNRGFQYYKMPTSKAISKSEYKNSKLSTEKEWDYWLRTPHPYLCDCTRFAYKGGVEAGVAYTGAYGIVPALNLKSDISIADGDGSEANPYIVKGISNNYESTNNISNIDAHKLLSINCTTEKLPVMISVKSNVEIDLSDIIIEYSIPVVGITYKFSKLNVKSIYDKSNAIQYIYIEVPPLCKNPKEGYDFTSIYQDILKVKIPSIGINTVINGEVNFISSTSYQRIAQKYDNEIQEIKKKGVLDIINNITISELDGILEQANSFVSEVTIQEEYMKKMLDEILELNEKSFDEMIKKRGIVTFKEKYSKADLLNDARNYAKELKQNRIESKSLIERTENLEKTIKQMKSQGSAMKFASDTLTSISVAMDLYSLKEGFDSITDNTNIMAKKYTGFLNVIAAEENILTTALVVTAKDQAIRATAKKLASFTFAAGITVVLADLSVDVREKAVEEVDELILDVDYLRREYEQRKLDLFLKGRKDSLSGNAQKLNNDELKSNQLLYEAICERYAFLIKKMNDGDVRYALSEDWFGWLNIIGIHVNTTAADTYKAMYEFSLKQLEKDGNMYLNTFYNMGYINDIRYLRFIYIDDYYKSDINDNQNGNSTILPDGMYKVEVSKAYSKDTNVNYVGIIPYTTYELIWDYIKKTDFDSETYYQKNYPVKEMRDGRTTEIPIQQVPEKIGITKDRLLEILKDYPGPSDDTDFWNMPTGEVMAKLNEKCIIKLGGTVLGDIFLTEKKPPVNCNSDLVSRISQTLEKYKNSEYKNIYNIKVEIKNGEIVKFTEIYHP